MDESKRRLLKVLPMAAVAGAAIKVGAVEGQAIEIKPAKKYILKLPALEYGNYTQDDLNAVRDKLKGHGFPDMLVISGECDLYELEA